MWCWFFPQNVWKDNIAKSSKAILSSASSNILSPKKSHYLNSNFNIFLFGSF